MVDERPQASCENWISSDSVKNRIILIIGFSGLLLWFVVKEITTLNFNEYEVGSVIIKPVFLIAAISFTVSILIGILAFYKIKGQKIKSQKIKGQKIKNHYGDDQSKWLMNTVK